MVTKTKTFTDDAWLGATRLTHTDDALIGRYAVKKTHTDDAYLKKQRTHTDDALIVEARGSLRGSGVTADRDAITNPYPGDTFYVYDDPSGNFHHYYTGSYWMPAQRHQAAEQGTPRNFSSPTAMAGVRTEQGDLTFPIRLWDGSQVYFSLDAAGNLYANSEAWGSASSLDNADTITMPENPLAVVPTRRQARSATGTTSASPTWSPATAAGNLLVFISWATGAGTPTITTPPSGYTLAVDSGVVPGGHRVVIYYKANSAGSDANPSITWSGSTSCAATIEEVTGIVTGSPLGSTAFLMPLGVPSTQASTGVTAPTTKASEWAVGAIGGTPGTAHNPDSGFSTAVAPAHLLMADRPLTAKGKIGFNATFNPAGISAGAIATFKVASGGVVATPPLGSGSFFVAAKAGVSTPYFMDDAGVAHDLTVPTGHYASLSKGATQSLSTGSRTPIVFGTEDVDTDAFHDVVTNNTRITIPAGLAGFYMIGGQVDFASSANGNIRTASIDVNGSVTIATAPGAPLSAGLNSRAIVVRGWFLNAGDYVELLGNQDSGGALAVQTTSTFWIAKVG